MEPTERLSAAEYKALLAGGAKSVVGTKREIRLPKGLKVPKAKRDARPSAIIGRITKLMDISSLRLQPEERLAVEFADELRRLTREGLLRAVWTHPANEIAGRRSGLSRIRYAIAKRMGMVDGAADYLFLWSDGSGVLEAKVGSNGLQPNQMDFQWWCERNGVRHRVFTTVEEGLAALREWGAILDEASPIVD